MRIRQWKHFIITLWIAYAITSAIMLWQPITGQDLPIYPPATLRETIEALALTGVLVVVLTYAIIKHRHPPANKQFKPKQGQ